jgi:hypothetical protein
MRNKSPELVSSFETDRTRAFAEIVEVTDSLKVRKLAIYVEMEAALFQALSQAWPEQKNDPGLRLLANIGLGVLRLARDEWWREPDARSLADHVMDGFVLLERQIGPRSYPMGR